MSPSQRRRRCARSTAGPPSCTKEPPFDVMRNGGATRTLTPGIPQRPVVSREVCSNAAPLARSRRRTDPKPSRSSQDTRGAQRTQRGTSASAVSLCRLALPPVFHHRDRRRTRESSGALALPPASRALSTGLFPHCLYSVCHQHMQACTAPPARSIVRPFAPDPGGK